MRTDIFIGIDMGSTGLKAVAFEAGSGATLAAAGGALPHIRLPGGGCELADSAIREALTQALRSVSQQLGSRVGEVRAIGCTGHGAGLYALGTQGELLRGRLTAQAERLGASNVTKLG